MGNNALVGSVAEGWMIRQGSGGHWEFWMNCGVWGQQVLDTGINVASTLGHWEHIVGTYDGTTQKVYVNGSLAASQTITHTYVPNTANPLLIGSGFNGKVDDVSVYSTALSATQIATHYAASSMQGATTTSDYDHTDLTITSPASGQQVSIGQFKRDASN